jgi:nucleolar complex protein 3
LEDVLDDALETVDVPDAGEVEERDWNVEQSYEEKPRKGDSQWRKKESTRLPIRKVNGAVHTLEASASESESSDEPEESDSDGEPEEVVPVADEKPTLTTQEAVIEAKESLAKLAEEIIEQPEEKVSLKECIANKISNLKNFREIYNKGNPTIKKLALITQLTVYKDIIPGYHPSQKD